MAIHGDISVEAGSSAKWVAPALRGSKFKPAPASGLVHSYTSDTFTLTEADWVYLQVALIAYQIHPATLEELDTLGPLGGANAARWTIEGPLMHRAGDPGEETNCALKVEVAHSLTAEPGTDWRDYEAGKYRLRSVVAKLTITRPSTAYNFRVARFALLATRVATPQRPRIVHGGAANVIPAKHNIIASRDYEISGSLEIEAGAYLEILT